MSRIIVPQADLRGGAVARPAAPVNDGIGDAAAALGARVQQLGRHYEDDRLSRDLGRARVDMANELSAARVEFDAIGDPDEIERGWSARVGELRNGLSDRVDPQNREPAQLAFDELAGRHGLAVGLRQNELRKSQSLAQLVEHQLAIEASPGIADFDEREVLSLQFADGVIDKANNGHIAFDKVPAMIAAQRASLASAAAIRLRSEDPERLVAEIDDGRFSDLPAEARETYRAQGVAEIGRRSDARIREASLIAKQEAGELGAQLRNATSIALSGRRMEGEDALLASPTAQEQPGYAEAVAAVQLRNDMPGFGAMTPGEQRAMIDAERAKTVRAPHEVRRLNAMEEIHAGAVRLQNRDTAADETTRAARLADVAALAGAGRQVDGEAELMADPAMQALPEYAAAAAAIELRNSLPDFAALTPGEQAAIITAERAKPISERFEDRKLTAMERIHSGAAAAQARAAVADETTRAARLADVAALAGAGRQVDGEAELMADPAMQALPEYAAAAAAIELRNSLPDFAALTPAEQAAQITAERVRPIAERFEDRKLSAMEAAYTATTKAWKADPIAQAQALEIGTPAALPTDLSDPDEWTAVFAARRSFGRGLMDDGYISGPAFFTQAERAQLTTLTAKNQDPRMRAVFAASIAGGFGEDAPRAFAAISDDPVFSHVGGLMAAGGGAAAAVKAFEGQTAIAAKSVTLPTDALRREWLFEAAGPLLAQTFADDAATQTAILETANAIYAAGAQGVDPKDAPDVAFDLWTEALQTAMGAARDARGEMTGGVQDVRDVKTWLPVGVSAMEVDRVLDHAAALLATESPELRLNQSLRGAAPAAPDAVAPQPIDAWSMASVSGGQPLYGDAPLSEGPASRAALVAVGDGLYRVVVTRGSTQFNVTDSQTGGHFVLSWEKLRDAIAGAGR